MYPFLRAFSNTCSTSVCSTGAVDEFTPSNRRIEEMFDEFLVAS
ncbi:hypothetical protein Rrhod_0434 [Rhodococcus rhodnii LMG 5362]|uniref:Uncharacterized protein n=1 Tax=Rhodococcus rhodnii LMG 5362 TaxID=1273125 RepID=R7WSF8_9NOCA|nr:hypothetical protein Rrhod_0434 [Rhodococcus rhodnii LMG 5362]